MLGRGRGRGGKWEIPLSWGLMNDDAGIPECIVTRHPQNSRVVVVALTDSNVVPMGENEVPLRDP